MLGYAAQKGLLPVSIASIQEAIRLNATFVEGNLRTFALGRLAAHEPEALARELGDKSDLAPLATVDDVLASRTRLLTAYQDASYAERYRNFVSDVRTRVALRQLQRGESFVREVALTLARLMAYKDEYEVARLYTDPKFMQRMREQFSGDFKMTFHLAPPMLPGHDASGRPKKRAFGAWVMSMFKVLAWLKPLRGTSFDLFGYTAERRMERHAPILANTICFPRL
jgi:indolepyruvate ferredoxin oxidoreductase